MSGWNLRLYTRLSCWCQDLMCQEDSAQHTDTVFMDTVPATLLSSVGPYPASGGNSAVCPLYVSLPFEMANGPEMDLKLKWFNLNVAAGCVSEARIDKDQNRLPEWSRVWHEVGRDLLIDEECWYYVDHIKSFSHFVGEASYAAQVHLHGWLLTGPARAVDINIIEANPPQWPDSVTWRVINYIQLLQGVLFEVKVPVRIY